MALYFHTYSNFIAAPGIYLEDLVVKSEYRKKGYGKALLEQLAKEVLKARGKRLQWSCIHWNQASLDFYQSEIIRATKQDQYISLKVEGEALSKLARTESS